MRAIPFLSVFTLAACQAVVIPLPIPLAAGDDACGASQYQSLVGQPVAAITLPADLNLRVIQPDDAVTMDFQPARLNLYVGEDGLVDRVSCG